MGWQDGFGRAMRLGLTRILVPVLCCGVLSTAVRAQGFGSMRKKTIKLQRKLPGRGASARNWP